MQVAEQKHCECVSLIGPVSSVYLVNERSTPLHIKESPPEGTIGSSTIYTVQFHLFLLQSIDKKA